MTEETIMLVEDDESIRRLLEVALKGQGYHTVSFGDALSALTYLETQHPAVAVFDVMMEGMDGVTAVKLIRQNPKLKQLPIIMLTAKDTEGDKVTGLDAGADDYVTKPFSIIELSARIRAQIRRFEEGAEQAGQLEAGGVRLSRDTRGCWVDGVSVELTYKEFELLYTLMAQGDKAMSRSELLRTVWGEDYYGETRTLDIHIGMLRQKLGDTADHSRFIRTIRGVGYRFVGGVNP